MPTNEKSWIPSSARELSPGMVVRLYNDVGNNTVTYGLGRLGERVGQEQPGGMTVGTWTVDTLQNLLSGDIPLTDADRIAHIHESAAPEVLFSLYDENRDGPFEGFEDIYEAGCHLLYGGEMLLSASLYNAPPAVLRSLSEVLIRWARATEELRDDDAEGDEDDEYGIGAQLEASLDTIQSMCQGLIEAVDAGRTGFELHAFASGIQQTTIEVAQVLEIIEDSTDDLDTLDDLDDDPHAADEDDDSIQVYAFAARGISGAPPGGLGLLLTMDPNAGPESAPRDLSDEALQKAGWSYWGLSFPPHQGFPSVLIHFVFQGEMPPDEQRDGLNAGVRDMVYARLYAEQDEQE